MDYLAREDLQWRKRFVSGPWLLTVYPQNLTKNNPALTLSTQLGEHWLTLWTYHQICEVIDSYVNLGNVRTSNSLKSLEVCGDQCKVPGSHHQLELWQLHLALFETQCPCTHGRRIFDLFSAHHSMTVMTKPVRWSKN